MSEILLALGLMLALEGLIYAAFPKKARHWAQMILTLKPESIQRIGLVCAVVGTVIVWWARTQTLGSS